MLADVFRLSAVYRFFNKGSLAFEVSPIIKFPSVYCQLQMGDNTRMFNGQHPGNWFSGDVYLSVDNTSFFPIFLITKYGCR